MKNNKLKIGELKVESFVTSIEENYIKTLKGGFSSIGLYFSHAPYHDGCKGFIGNTKDNHTKGIFCGSKNC